MMTTDQTESATVLGRHSNIMMSVNRQPGHSVSTHLRELHHVMTGDAMLHLLTVSIQLSHFDDVMSVIESEHPIALNDIKGLTRAHPPGGFVTFDMQYLTLCQG